MEKIESRLKPCLIAIAVVWAFCVVYINFSYDIFGTIAVFWQRDVNRILFWFSLAMHPILFVDAIRVSDSNTVAMRPFENGLGKVSEELSVVRRRHFFRFLATRVATHAIGPVATTIATSAHDSEGTLPDSGDQGSSMVDIHADHSLSAVPVVSTLVAAKAAHKRYQNDPNAISLKAKEREAAREVQLLRDSDTRGFWLRVFFIPAALWLFYFLYTD